MVKQKSCLCRLSDGDVRSSAAVLCTFTPDELAARLRTGRLAYVRNISSDQTTVQCQANLADLKIDFICDYTPEGREPDRAQNVCELILTHHMYPPTIVLCTFGHCILSSGETMSLSACLIHTLTFKARCICDLRSARPEVSSACAIQHWACPQRYERTAFPVIKSAVSVRMSLASTVSAHLWLNVGRTPWSTVACEEKVAYDYGAASQPWPPHTASAGAALDQRR